MGGKKINKKMRIKKIIELKDKKILDKYNGITDKNINEDDLIIDYVFYKNRDLTYDFMIRNNLEHIIFNLNRMFDIKKLNIFEYFYKLKKYDRISIFLERLFCIEDDFIECLKLLLVMNNFENKELLIFINNLDKIKEKYNNRDNYKEYLRFIEILRNKE